MIKWAFIFLVVGLVAGLFGLSGLAGAAVDIAMFLFGLAIVIFLVLIVLGYTLFKKTT